MLSSLLQAIAAADTGNWQEVEKILLGMPLHGRSEREREEILGLAMRVLEVGDFQSRWDISKLIAKLGETALDRLLPLCVDEELDPEQRWFAVRLLGDFPSLKSVLTLGEIFRQTEPTEELLTAATAALATIGSTAIPALVDLLATPDRAAAVAALAQIRTTATIEPLLTILDDTDPALRATAMEALSSFHDDRLLPIWLEKITDPVPAVRIHAITALSLRAGDLDPVATLDRLAPLLWDLNSDVCCSVAVALSRFAHPRAAEIAGERLLSGEIFPTLRSKLILCLSWLAKDLTGDLAIDYLERALILAPPAVAVEIITSIGRLELPHHRSSKVLHRYIDSQPQSSLSIDAKQALVQALGNLNDVRSVDYLIQYLNEPVDRLKFQVIAALKKISADLPAQVHTLAADRDLDPHWRSGVELCIAEWT
jgi:HEAT repeat protein